MRGSTDISGGIDIILFPMQISKKSKRPFAHFFAQQYQLHIHNLQQVVGSNWTRNKWSSYKRLKWAVKSGPWVQSKGGLWPLGRSIWRQPGDKDHGNNYHRRNIIPPWPISNMWGSTMAPLNGGEDLDLGHISLLSNPLWAGHTIVWAHNLSKKCGPVT